MTTVKAICFFAGVLITQSASAQSVSKSRPQERLGDNLWTFSIAALNIEPGKLAWHFQASPHDTHDWDAVQTPVLIDGEIDGKPRKLIAQASRNCGTSILAA